MAEERRVINEVKWWVYVVAGLVLWLFAAPRLISARDTIAVLVGVAALVLYGVWTWKLWARDLVKKAIELTKKELTK